MCRNYIEVVNEANKGGATDICFPNPVRKLIEKGVRQGDPLSPKLFTVCLKILFSKLK